MLRDEYIKKLIPRLNERQKEKNYIPKYLKPKMIHDEYGQYPYRCPICWQKYILKELAQNCVDKCWDELPDLVWKQIEIQSKEPKEVGSWQWDLDETHEKYCGVVLYNTGEVKYFKGYPTVEFITEDELVELLKENDIRLFQKGSFELSNKFDKFKECERAKNKECERAKKGDPNRFELLRKAVGIGEN